MDEEIKVEEAEVVEHEYSPAEIKAMESGWQPKEEWEKNPDNANKKWRDAEEFNERGELFAKIEELGKKQKTTQRALDDLNAHHKKVKETEYKRALETLKAQKKAALEDGDADRLIAIDDKIAEVRQAQRQETPTENVPQELQEWISHNRWYETDSDLATDADALGIAYKQKNPDKSMSEVLNYVETRIKKLNPEKFENPNKPKTKLVEQPTNSKSSTTKVNGRTLTEDEERVMKNLIRANVMTKAEYIKQLEDLEKGK